MNPELEQRVLDKTWFYRYRLPSGRETKSYDDGALDAIHATRLAMMDSELSKAYPDGLAGKTAVDLACHQGWFTMALAQRGVAKVTGVDARTEHVEDSRLIAQALGHGNVEIAQHDVHRVGPDELGTHDVVVCFGLIYHLEDPVGALRVARSLCKGVCLVETQVVPNMSGPVDWGSYRFVKPLKGVFGIIDETYELHGPEMSITGVCLAPSTEGLLWIMQAIGFRDVHVIAPPDDAYEQHRYGKRVMVAGYV
jgi:tRNA (mo5U34)-methyltransferase